VKWLKLIVAIVLIPVCAGAVSALWRVLRACGPADTTWVPILAGCACWLVIYVLLPRPMLVYVFGHELTHALWTWAFGGKVKQFKASSKGGHVVVTKDNFLIALAPYFFPLYAVMVVLAFLVGQWIWNWNHYLAVFHVFLGAAYAFHVTLTWHILKHDQTDISQQGYIFSAVIIFIGNVLVLLIGIPLLAPRVDVATALGWWLQSTGQFLHQLGRVI
jgi:hypothetical protein